MVASGNAVMLRLPALSFSLSLLICSSCRLIISLLTTRSFFSRFSLHPRPASHLFPPSLLSSFVSPSLHLSDYYGLVEASGSGAVYVSDGGVCSLHSLLRSATIDFFGAYLTYSLHISLSE